MEGGGDAAQAQQKRSRERSAKLLGWSTGPDYLLVLRSRHCQTVGLYELREEARSDLLPGNTALQVCGFVPENRFFIKKKCRT